MPAARPQGVRHHPRPKSPRERVARRTMRGGVILAALMAILWPMAARAGEPRLWLVAPAAAGALSDCSERAATAVRTGSSDARLLDSEAMVRWRGGQVRLRGERMEMGRKSELWDKCFALAVDGRIIVSGATLVPHSARALKIPVLKVMSWRGGDTDLEFELVPAFPEHKSTMSAQEWLDRLAALR